MTESNGDYELLYTPSITNVTGSTDLEILALDTTDNFNIVNDDGTIDGVFYIKNNMPSITLNLNATEIYRTQFLDIDAVPSDIEDSASVLEWEITLDNENLDSEIVLVEREDSLFNTEYQFEDNCSIGIWTLKATCWDKDNNTENEGVSEYFDFEVKNNEPDVYSFDILNQDEESIRDDFTIKRGETFILCANVSDVDSSLDKMRLRLEAEFPGQDQSNMFSNYTDIEPNNDVADWLFYENITVPTNINLGQVILSVIAYVNDSTSVEHTRIVNMVVRNNAPVLNNFYINGMGNDTQISIDYGEIVTFTVNGTDVENDIEYIRVEIQYTDELDEEQTIVYSTPYTGKNTELNIRTSDLTPGRFIATVYVIDSDGAQDQSYLQEFSINEEKQTISMFWLMFVVGIILGSALSIGFMYAGLKRKIERDTLIKMEKDTNNLPSSSKKDLQEEKPDISNETEADKESTGKAKSQKSKKRTSRRL